MFLSILKYVRGYLLVTLTGYAPERFLNLCSNHNILIWELRPFESGYRFYISIAGFRRLRPILRKTKTKIRIESKKGLPFWLFRYRKRKLFVIGIFAFFIALYWLSGYIWKIEIEGNSYLSEEVLLDFLEKENSSFGTRKSKIDCAALEEELRSTYENVIWASIQIYGTKLTLSIQENLLPEESYEEQDTESLDIVATKDGTITSIVTRNGTPFVTKDAVVVAGDILVSGRIDLYDDNGEISEYQYCTADADIYADVSYEYQDRIAIAYEDEVYTGNTSKNFRIRICQFFFENPWFQSDFEKENIVTTSNQLCISDNFYLPFYFEEDLYQEYEIIEKEYSETEINQLAEEHLNTYISNLEEKGVQIIEKNVIIEKERNSYLVSGTIKANESIVSYAPTQILEITREEEQQSDESD